MHNLHRLLAENRGRGTFRADTTGNEATIYLYDAIVADDLTAEFWGGVSAPAFVKELNAIDAPVIHLRINSPGGDVFGARAMEQAMREHKSTIIAHVDGYAASAASYLALAADEVHIADGGFFMIHKAWTFAYGNADDLMTTAALLEKVDESLVSTYVKETGQSAEDIRNWMKAETWFNAEEAVANGFADKVATGNAKNSSRWNLAAYAHAPKVEPPAAEEPPEKPEPAAPVVLLYDTDHLKRRLELVHKTA